jgi:hypothetical protein
MQNEATKSVSQETFSSRVATKVQPVSDSVSTFLTRCGKPKSTDD